jgi:hypothetical protein
MANKKNRKREYTLEQLYNPQIDLSRDAYLYGRQSGKDQVIENIQSHISQTIMLLEYTRGLGFRDDGTTGNVTLLVENEVVDADGNISIKDASGTWPIDRRQGLKTICDAIEYGTENKKGVGIVIAEFVDRLFRDEDRIDSNVFIKICREHDCYVHISSKRMTYNLANPAHAELFRLEVQMAAAYIENHVRGTMHRRRSLAAKSGQWAGLGSIPVGYIVDRDKKSPNYGIFIIYDPHAQVVRWLFVRIVELGYDLIALKRELAQMPNIFPAFEPWVDTAIVNKCNLREQNGGYSFCETTLERILTNDVYIGTYRREGIVKRNHHPAIVDEELFWCVYDRLKDFRPDGSPTGRTKLVRYSQQASSKREALLVFTSSQEKVSVCFGTSDNWHHYVARRNNGMGREALLAIDADFIENAVVKKLFEKLQYVDLGDLEQKRKTLLQEKAARVKRLERDIETIDEEVSTLTENMGKIKTDAVVLELEGRIARLLERKTEAQAEIEKITTVYSAIAIGTLEEELQDLEQFWDERSFELKKSLLRLLIKEASLDYISPRFFRVTITWAYGDWGIEQAIFDKGTSNKEWTTEENTLLRELYPDRDQLEIMQSLPTRSWRSILGQAGALGLKREVFKHKTIKDIHISLKDIEFLEKSGLRLEDFRNGNGVRWCILLPNTLI